MRPSGYQLLAAALAGARRSLLALTTAAALAVAFAAPSGAAPESELWERWTAHDATATAGIDHGLWDGFLKRYVTVRTGDASVVAYGKVSGADRGALEAYISALEATPISRFNRDEQLAYWINLYNALTVKVILDHYPVESIRDIDISPGWFADGPWGAKLVAVEGEELSLDDIEHRILRPIWQDPRIHYGVNCASIGCPDLGTEAVTAANAEDYLDAGARAFVNSARGASVLDGELYVSSLYRWFEEDFDVDGGVVAHLRNYADQGLSKSLAGITGIAGDDYDWDLNDAASPKGIATSNAGSRSPGETSRHRNLRVGGS